MHRQLRSLLREEVDDLAEAKRFSEIAKEIAMGRIPERLETEPSQVVRRTMGEEGYALPHVAVGNRDTFSFVVDRLGFEVDATTALRNLTPLCIAATEPDMVGFLEWLVVKRRANVEHRALTALNHPRRPIGFACDENNVEAVRALLRAGADAEAGRPLMHTNLHNPPMLETLLHYLPADECREIGFTPLMRAIHAGDDDAVDILLRYGADPTVASPCGATPLYIACVSRPQHVRVLLRRCAQRRGAAPAWQARLSDHIDEAATHPPDWRNGSSMFVAGATPLHALCVGFRSPYVDMLSRREAMGALLQEAGLKFSATATARGGGRARAATTHPPELVRFVNAPTTNARHTALHYAVQAQRASRMALVETLLHAGADPLALNAARQTPLAIACIVDNRRGVEFLLERVRVGDPRISAPDRYGRTAVEYASRWSSLAPSLRVLQMLMAHGAQRPAEPPFNSQWTAEMRAWYCSTTMHRPCHHMAMLGMRDRLEGMVRELTHAEIRGPRPSLLEMARGKGWEALARRLDRATLPLGEANRDEYAAACHTRFDYLCETLPLDANAARIVASYAVHRDLR